MITKTNPYPKHLQIIDNLHNDSQRLIKIIDSLPDPTFVLDHEQRVIAWNRSLEVMTGVIKEEILGKGEYEYSIPFYGTKRPLLIDNIFSRDLDNRDDYDFIQMQDKTLVAEIYVPTLYNGSGAYIWVKASPLFDDKGNLVGAIETVRDITDKKLAEIALQKSEERYRKLTESSRDIIFTYNMNSEITYINPVGLELSGYNFEEILGKSFYEFIPDSQHKKISRILNQRLQKDYDLYKYDTEFIDVDGNHIPIEISSVMFKDLDGKPCVLVSARDISERKNAEEVIRLSEMRFKDIFEKSNDAIYVLANNRFVLVNPRFLEILNYDSEDIKDKSFNFSSILTEESKSIFKTRNERIRRNQDVSNQFVFSAVAKGGVIIEFEASLSTIYWGEKPATLGVLRDITNRRKLEIQLQQAQRMESVGRLASGVAHDFNNLLTAISGFSELALMTLEKESHLGKTLREILVISDKAGGLVRQLLAFCSKQIISPVILDVNKTINEINKMLRRIINENIELNINLDEKLCKIEADPAQVEQIIVNLIVNAKDALPDGGNIDIITQNFDVVETIQGLPDNVIPGSYVKLGIYDDGIGMDSVLANRIFEPFFTTKPEGIGTGLGLSTVYGIVHQCRGHVCVESQIGKGSEFDIYLPRTYGEECVEIDFYPQSDEYAGDETILVVEDELNVRKVAVRLLKRFGYNILEAANGLEALDLIRRQPINIDLILSDVIMPKMSGYEMIERVKELWPETKVIFMSGYTENTIVLTKIFKQNVLFIQKPFKPMKLLKSIRDTIDGKVIFK